MKKLFALIAVAFTLIVLKAWFVAYGEPVEVNESGGLVIAPGKTLQLDVPDFGAEHPVKRLCEIRIPETYRPDSPVPILVWFSPGGGSNRIASVPPIVDKRQFLIAAIPYPGNKLPRLAIKAGAEKIDAFWEYQKPMLDYVRDLIPNIDPKVRIAAGFSSGAHLVGAGLDRDWMGFADFFTAYILHEGGYSPAMRFEGIREDHKVLITYGLQNRSYGKVVAREMKKAGHHPTVVKLPHTGHSMSSEAIEAIWGWIEQF
jgi:pimeloyl-ACP methyl ester carboxylesterase